MTASDWMNPSPEAMIGRLYLAHDYLVIDNGSLFIIQEDYILRYYMYSIGQLTAY